MKTKLKRFSKRSIAMLLSLLMMISAFAIMGTFSASAYDAHFTLVGDDVGWNAKQALNNVINSGASWYGYAYLTKGKYFALHNGSSQYSNGETFTIGDGGRQSSYTNNGFKYDSASQVVKICYDESNNREWYPWVWLEAANIYLSGDSGLASASWDTSGKSADKMTLSSGKYTITKTVATAGTYQYKVNAGDGWIYNPISSNQSVTTTHANDKVTITFNPSNKTCSATVTHPSYNVTLNTNGGTINAGNVTSYNCGTGATLPTNVTKTGYTFGGWYDNSSFTGSAVTSISTSATGNKTYYAKWTANSYSITYKDQGNVAFSGTHASGYPTTHKYGTATTLKSASKTGYTFGGWFTNSGCTGSAVTSLGATAYTSGITLYAKWTQNTYAITLSETGGSGTMKIDGTTRSSGYAVTHGSHTFRVDAPTGYVIDTISGIGTWTKASDNSYATLGSTSITSAQTISVTYAAAGRPSLDAIADVSKDANTTTFNVTANISDEDKKTGTLSATATSGTTSVATVGTPTVSGSTVTIPVTIKGVVGSSTISVTLSDGGTTLNTQTFSVSMEEPTFTLENKSITVRTKNYTLSKETTPTPDSISWTSSNTTYITVNSSGQVTAVKTPTSKQTSTITATASYASGYTKVVTSTVTLNVPTLTIQSSATSGAIGDTATASVNSANPAATYINAYSWSTSNSNVVSISDTTAASPTLTFKKNGTATISLEVTYKSTGLKKTNTNTLTITVNAPTVAFDNSAAVSLNIGESTTRAASGSTVGTVTSDTITYSSSASAVATVNSSGVITGVAPGSATITATRTIVCGGQTTTVSSDLAVTVNTPSLTMSNITGKKIGDTGTFTPASYSNPNSLKGTVSYAIKSGDSITVSGSGYTAVKPGTTTVTATYNYSNNSKTYTCAGVDFTVAVGTPTVSVTNGNKVAVGDELALTASSTGATTTPTYTCAITDGVQYCSVTGSTLTGTAEGSVTVQVTANYGNGYTKTATKTITVETPAITVKKDSTSVIDTTVYTTLGTNLTYTVGANFGGTLYTKSSNTSVATASLSGSTLTITPNAKGTATISVSTDSGYTPSNSAFNSPLLALSKTKLLLGAVSPTTVTFTVNVAEADTSKFITHATSSWSECYAWYDSTWHKMTKVGTDDSGRNVFALNVGSSYPGTVVYNSTGNWTGGTGLNQTVDITGLADGSNSTYESGESGGKRNVGSKYGTTITIPQLQVNNLSISLGQTASLSTTVLNNTTPAATTYTSNNTTIATVDSSGVVTGEYVGNTTVTVTAWAAKPHSSWNSWITDSTTASLLAGTVDSNISVTADPKTVTFGEKKTDDGSTFTNGSGHITAKYYDEDTSGSGSSGSGSGSSGSSGSDPEPSGGPYYLHIGKQSAFRTNTAIKFTWNGSYFYASCDVESNSEYPFVINTKNTGLGDSDKPSSAQSVTTYASTWNPDSIGFNSHTVNENNYDGFYCFKFQPSSAGTIYITFTPSGGVAFRSSVSSGSSGSSGSGGSGGGESGSGTGYTGEGTTMNSPASVPYGKVAVFTAQASYTSGTDTYAFAEWVDGSNNTLSTDLEYVVKITEAKNVYARYYKVFKLSAFDSYELVSGTVNFVTAPPKVISVKHGTDTYIYNFDGTAPGGHPGTPDDPQATYPDPLPVNSGGTYGQGNYIQYLAGDEITLTYSAMASSETFKGVFYNNSVEYYLAKPTAEGFIAHDYTAEHTLYMNSAYYASVPSGLPTTTVDNDAHSIKFIGTQDYKNIDIEVGTKRKVYFSDYTNAIIGSKNTDDYYYDGEALSVTGDQLTVSAAGNATQTNSINKDNIKFYRADANGQKTGSELSGFTVAYDSGTDPVTNSGSDASTRYIIISGNMPSYDLYIDLGIASNYSIKLGSKVMADPFESKTRLSQIATVTIKEGSTTKLTAPSNADVTSSSTSVNTGTALTLDTTYTGSWGNYYTFVGWYWGDDSAPDFDKGFISSKETASYIPKKGGTIWAVATRSLYINGSKYITGKDSDWYKENNTWKNLEMKFDPDRGTKGSYYWEITDTMFAAAGNDFKYTSSNSGDTGGSNTEGKYFAGDDSCFYWCNNDDSKHGKAFFQLLDTETGYNNREIWKGIYSFKETADGTTHGKILKRDAGEAGSTENQRLNGQGFIDFAESRYVGYSSPLRIYLDADTKDLDVVATSIYSNLYVSNGYTVGSTQKTSAVTVEPVVDGVVKTSGQTGYFSVGKQGAGWDPDVEGHVNHYKPQKKGATVRITKTAGGSDKIEAFFIYDITNKTVRAERDVKTATGNKYYIDLTLAGSTQNLYIVPIVEEAGANVTVTFDATQLNRKQWGDIVTAYAWYQNNGGAALGDYPGQPMIPSDDMTTWTAKFKGVKNSKELEGITFSNYVDGAHSWLGCSDVMSSVSYGGAGTESNPTTVTFGDNGLIKQYNYIESGTNKEFSRGNFKAQTYDYREPIALYDRFKSSDNVSISFSMKDGNSSLISWRHSNLTLESEIGEGENILNLPSGWTPLRWEYLTNAKGDKYIDLNGNTMKTKPTASFYIAAKGQVLYNNSSMTNVFYSGKQFDPVSGVTYGGASGVSMNYAVQWYVYDASGNYITNVLTAGIADMSSNNVDSYIGKVLEDKGYAVDGKSVSICYDKPRYMYGDSNTASSGQAAGYNGKGINVSNDFDAYRFTGQWNAVASNELVKVNVGVGMMTDSGEVLASSNTTGYGNATATYDTTKGNNAHVTNEDGDTAPFTASDNSFVRTAVRDAENNPVKLNASSQNFIGWYYYDANTGDFVKANYASNENFYPNYSNKDVTFYAMYRASAVYQYKYTGREGARTYSASGNDLTADELANHSVITPASHEADIKNKVPVGIGIFKKNIDFSPTSYSGWTKTPDQNGYILDITGFATSTPEYTLTAYYKDANGELQTKTKTAVYNGAAVNLTDLNDGSPVTAYYDKPFLGWYAYDGGEIGELISTQTNYGLRLTREQAVIAVYDEDGETSVPEDGWHVSIDENEVNKELTTSETGVYYNDTIVRVRNGADVRATLPDGAKIGVLVVCDNKTNETINGYNSTQLATLANAVTSGSTKKTAKGISITNMQAATQTSFNRTDIAVRRDYKTTLGAKYCVYAYIKNGSTYTFSDVSNVKVKTYE
jgi:uncharacterized repeat protein (TIGR02543 family)